MTATRRKILFVLPILVGALLMNFVKFLAASGWFFFLWGAYSAFVLQMFISPNRMFDRPIFSYATKTEFLEALILKENYLRSAIAFTLLVIVLLLYKFYAYSNAFNTPMIASSDLVIIVGMIILFSLLFSGASYYLLKWIGALKTD